MKKHLITIFIILGSYWGTAQSTTQCARSLSQAELAFEQGRLTDIINSYTNSSSGFSRCLANGVFSDSEEVRAYKLLTKAYLFQDDEEKAEEMLVKLLRADKEHQLSPEDPAELYILYAKFKTEPIFRFGIRAGANMSQPVVLTEHSTNPNPDAGKLYNSAGSNGGPGIGFWVEGLLERHLYKGIEIALGPQLQIVNYRIENDFAELQYLVQHQFTKLNVPLLVRYNLGYSKVDQDNNRAKLIPYVFLGGAYEYTLNAKYLNTNRTGGTTYTLPDTESSLKNNDQVTISNVSVFGGIGTKLRISNVHFLTFELRYSNSLFNHTNYENRYSNQSLYNDIAFIEDDLTINTLAFSIGFTKSLYKPRKRKEYR